MKRINLNVDDKTHAAFKSKAAAQGLSMAEILSAAIDDYMTGKYKPTKKGKAKA